MSATSTSDRYTNVSEGFARIVEGCPDDRWGASTPCEGWTGAELYDHVLGVNASVLDRVGRAVPTDHAGDRTSRWRAVAAAVREVIDDPELAGVPVSAAGTEIALRQLVGGIVVRDVLVHTWDLARASGGPELLDAEAVHHVFESARPLEATLRRPGVFGPAIEVPDDADEQTRFLAFTGRRV